MPLKVAVYRVCLVIRIYKAFRSNHINHLQRLQKKINIRHTCQVDIKNYAAIWVMLKKSDLKRLKNCVNLLKDKNNISDTKIRRKLQIHQPRSLDPPENSASYLVYINEKFDTIGESLYADAKALATKVSGCTFKIGPPKNYKRCFEKATTSYRGNLSRITDFRRASIVFPDLETMITFLSEARTTTWASRLLIKRITNRFDENYNANELSAGYRDVQ